MTEQHPIDAGRLGELVNGARPAGEEERALAALIAEARELEPGASDDLRRRVLDDARRAAPVAAPAWRGRALDPRRWLGGGEAGRRRLLVAAPVTAAVVALMIAIPVLDGGGGGDATSPLPEAAGRLAAPEASPSGPADSGAAGVAPPAPASGAPSAVAPAPAPVPATGRLQRITTRTRVMVDGVAALSRASASAMRTARDLGGYTARSDYGVPDGGRGTNELVFRVPAGRVDEALAAFGRLGVVIGQDADIVDVTDRVAAADRGVARLRERLAGLRARAAADPADAARAVAVVRAESALARAEAAVAAQRERARLAVVHLTLTTEGPPAVAEEEGRFAGPITGAGVRLADALAWTLGALVLLAPFAAVAALAVWGVTRLRGRSARRVMRAT